MDESKWLLDAFQHACIEYGVSGAVAGVGDVESVKATRSALALYISAMQDEVDRLREGLDRIANLDGTFLEHFANDAVDIAWEALRSTGRKE